MKRLLVIDGDNISPTTFSSGWNNLEKDTIVEKILYGDFSKTEMVNWQKFAIENNINLYHCPRNNKKQTTDLNIFIDVMTKLYENNFDELLMVTNDSDFILLANAWIKKGKKVTFYSSNNCSNLIKNNFIVVHLDNNSTTKKKSNEKNTTENIKNKLLKFIENNCETTIKQIKQELEKYYGKIKPKRITKLLEKIESNYLWIIEDNKNIEDNNILYYPKLEEIKQNNSHIKTLKTFIKRIKKVYTNFDKFLNFNSIDDIYKK